MKKIYLLVIALFLMVPLSSSSQGLDCSSATPLCFSTTSSTFTYPASVNVADIGMLGCLYTTPNPAWFFFVVSDTGSIDINITSGGDVDFICWGPFYQPPYPCNSLNISDSTIADCSYTAAVSEVCSIPTAITGAFYVLLITNFGNIATNVTVSQSNFGADTAASIQCMTLDSVSSNSPLCLGDTLVFTAPYIDSASYHWTGPNGFSSNDQNPIIPNIQQNQEGTYTVIISQGVAYSYGNIYVDVLPLPSAVFNAILSGGGAYTFYVLDAADSNIMYFGDGTFMEDVPLHNYFFHQYDTSGLYEVTLVCYNECGSDTAIQYAIPEFLGYNDGLSSGHFLYPNPTTGKCSIEGLPINQITLVECRSIDGKLLYSGLAAGISDGSNTLIDLSNYSPGMYTITIQTSSNRYAVKVIRGENR